jgi:ADP-heptose:LPS heptosyltransferase
MPTEKPLKILAINFRYLGDTVVLVPALRAIREHYPGCELHVLVPEESGPLLQHLPWLTRLWLMPRRRGHVQFKKSWPILRALRAERFDRSVDFTGNDRSAIATFFVDARQRLGFAGSGGFLGRYFCYTQRMPFAPRDRHESLRLASLLTAWEIEAPRLLETEIHTDLALDSQAQKILPEPKIICHLSSSQPRKEWPLTHWATLHQMAAAVGIELFFSTGVGTREESLLKNFKQLAPTAPILQPIPEFALYLAVLKRARVFVTNDTGPLHFAAGVGTPTLALFGPTSSVRWAPVGQQHRFLTGSACTCDNVGICQSVNHCIASITPEKVFVEIKKLIHATDASSPKI